MEELVWLYGRDPGAMLRFLHGRASGRKLRLFACACCRGLFDVTPGERHADGAAAASEVVLRTGEVRKAAREAGDEAREEAASVWCITVLSGAVQELIAAAEVWRDAAADPDEERRRQCDLLRELFGNPFQPRRLDAAWLRWNDGAVRKMVRAVYDEGRFADLPVLADALEEAGCDDAFLLYHCRNGGDHVRGCWAVDLLMGRE